PSSSLSNSQVYYVAINSVADTAGNLTTLQSVTFTTEAGTPQPAGTVLAGWTFPAEDPSSATADLGIAGNIGVKTISRESGFSGNYTYPVGYAPTNEYITGTTATRSISTEDWNLDDESWIISFTTTGYEEIKFYSDIRSSNTGPKNFRIDYSFDGSSWTPTGNTVALSGTAMSQLNGDLPAACDNQATVYLRWINPDNVSANGGTVAAAGANRIDNIVIAGTLLSGSVDTDAPVLTFNPADGATNVAVNTAITITADEPLRKADGSELTDGDLTPALVVLKETDAGGTDVAFTATIDAAKKVITVTPSSSLSNSQVYYAALNPVADTASNLTTLQSVTFTTEAPLSSEADLIDYTIANQISDDINHADKTVNIVMPAGTDITSLTAAFTVSQGAAVTVTGTPQVSGTTANDFTNPVVYKIVSQDGTVTSYWTVTVTVELNSEADIIAFTIPGQAGGTIIDADEATVIVTMPYGTDVTGLVPAITVSDYASISPLSGAAQDFTGIVAYTVTAQDGTVKAWNVSVVFTAPPPSNDNFIISFTLPGQTETTIIDSDARTVTVPMPVGISLADLIPLIHISSGATISPSANTIRDFSNPVIYTVTSESGISALWVVKVQQGSADDGLLFSFINGTQIFHIENRTLGIGKIDIYSNDGRLMYSGKRGSNSEFNNTEFNIDMSGYAGGMYIIRIFNKNHAFTKTIKIIK
ncbi:MAG: Ig-like domain-containing protein, partial [Prevotellaceae bacterium]|nr:Ig-like domain-containing protein [Prevotellaceae bacterium]